VLTLFAVNPTPAPVTRPLDLSAFGDGEQVLTMWTLADSEEEGEPDVTNSFAAPTRVSVAESKQRVTSGKFEYRFPPLSLTVIRLTVKRS
jgi:alpha-L-arabinofuranosidase